jgi:hypothetical protein
MAPLKTFYAAIKQLFPLNLTFQIPTSGDIISEANGQVIGTWTGTGGGSETSSAGTGGYAGSAGAVLRWVTGGVVNGHRVVGRTYLVPMHQNSYATDGSLQATVQTTVQTAALALLGSYVDGLKVWARPTPPGHPNPRVGGIHTATSALVPDIAAVMRSRRI